MRLRRTIRMFLLFTIIIMSTVATGRSSSTAQSNIISYGEISYSNIALPDGSLSRLHVDGNKIKNAQGQQVLLRGAAHASRSYYYNLDGAPAHYSQGQQDQYSYMKNWGATVVMIGISMPPSGSDGSDWNTRLNVMEAQVDYAEDVGLYALIDGFQSYNVGWIVGTWTSADWATWISAWEDVATRLKGRTNVIYDLIAEPSGISAETWVTRARQCIDAIRTIDPDIIVICEALSVNEWYDDGFAYQKNIGINRPNLIFDYHTFQFESRTETPSYASHYSWFNQIGGVWLLDNDYPVISQQFNADSRNPNCELWLTTILEFFHDYDIGYTGWLWGTFQSDGEWFDMCNDWKGTPSAQGLVLQKYLQTSN